MWTRNEGRTTCAPPHCTTVSFLPGNYQLLLLDNIRPFPIPLCFRRYQLEYQSTWWSIYLFSSSCKPRNGFTNIVHQPIASSKFKLTLINIYFCYQGVLSYILSTSVTKLNIPVIEQLYNFNNNISMIL